MRRLLTKESRLASRYAPSNFEKIEHPEGLGVAYIGQSLGASSTYWSVRKFRGTASKYENSTHKSEAEARAEVEKWFQSLSDWKKIKAERRTLHSVDAPIKHGDYLSVTQTAGLIRKALTKKFPTVKFSVVSSSYSMGASITVAWTDGPTSKEVDEVTGLYEGAGFDGSIDLKYHVDHWLLPDGSVQVAHTSGTSGSRGYVSPINNEKPHPEAVKVQFGADYVHTRRSHSELALLKAVVAVSERFGLPPVDVKDGQLSGSNMYASHPESRFDQRSLIHQYLEGTLDKA